MTVFVDNANIEHEGKVWCHMACDSADLIELHTLAKAIGLKRGWLHNGSMPHYDVTPSKRQLAIAQGAIEISKEEMVKLMQRYRVKCQECQAPFADEFFNPMQDEPEILCLECAHKGGYCLGCHNFWAGVESFDFNLWGTGMCQDCSHEVMESFEHDYDPEYPYEYDGEVAYPDDDEYTDKLGSHLDDY